MKTENCVTYSIHENGVKTGTCKICDPCAIILMTDDLPLVQIFDREGNRTDCGQYRTMQEVGDVLARALKGERLTMPNESAQAQPTTGVRPANRRA